MPRRRPTRGRLTQGHSTEGCPSIFESHISTRDASNNSLGEELPRDEALRVLLDRLNAIATCAGDATASGREKAVQDAFVEYGVSVDNLSLLAVLIDQVGDVDVRRPTSTIRDLIRYIDEDSDSSSTTSSEYDQIDRFMEYGSGVVRDPPYSVAMSSDLEDETEAQTVHKQRKLKERICSFMRRLFVCGK